MKATCRLQFMANVALNRTQIWGSFKLALHSEGFLLKMQNTWRFTRMSDTNLRGSLGGCDDSP